MAKKPAVWGIDIGNSSLKALRCQLADASGRIEATAFDFIEHSKILSQPGAEPAEIMAETLKTFLSRNKTKGDKVAVSVSGQNTISRFLKLPPVDPKKIPDIIKYEAKQWLPFALDDVIWGFQPIGNANPSPTAVPVDSEIGMFAMKRDIATKILTPYLDNAIDVDCIQSSPLAIYNFTAFDQLSTQNIEVFEPDNPPESLVILCVGTDATDVVITNGFSIWIRSIPIGGNVFTKALAKGLKLTFSKAEYIKRNVASAQDPKAVIQAMKPVFNEMLSEVHRSIEYYQSLNRKVKFNKILALGNAVKMPGLRQFLTQNLGYEVVRLSQFNRLVGSEITESPLFKENIASFAVSYGLALQLLDEAPLRTNLIPKEIIVDRIVREKKPWVLAMASAILLGLAIQFAGASNALRRISIGDYGNAENKAKNVQTYSAKLKSDTVGAVNAFKNIDTIGRNLTSNVEGRITWLELLHALNLVLPIDQEKPVQQGKNETPTLASLEKQNRLFISNIEAITVDDLAAWFAPLKEHKRYYPDDEEVIEALGATGGTTSRNSNNASSTVGGANAKTLAGLTESQRLELITGPTGPLPEGSVARIVQLVGYHYHNPTDVTQLMGSDYLRRTLLRKLKFGAVVLPSTLEKQKDPQTARETVSMRELGISYPTLLDIVKVQETEILNPRVVLEIFIQERKKALESRRGGGGFGGDNGRFGSGRGTGRDSRDPMASFSQTFADPFRSSADRGANANTGLEYIKKIAKEVNEKDKIKLRRFDFVVQFAWVETPPSVRERRREERQIANTTRQGSAIQSASDGETTAPKPAATPETSPAETPTVETSPVETSPVETSPDETSPDETSPDETSPDETSPDETSPDETSPDETPAETTEPTSPTIE